MAFGLQTDTPTLVAWVSRLIVGLLLAGVGVATDNTALLVGGGVLVLLSEFITAALTIRDKVASWRSES